MNRNQKRRRIIDRSFTKSNAKHIVNDYRYQRENPKGTNHDRMIQRKINREEAKINV